MNRQDVNKTINRVDSKGKPYATVDARVDAFWELYPEGSIVTELLHDDGERCVFRASAFSSPDGSQPIATGHAFEVKGASYINKTSYLENCETSAVGRALGFLGIGSNGSIASADEVQGALESQGAAKAAKPKKDAPKPKTAPQKEPDEQIQRIQKLKQQCLDAGVTPEGVSSWYETRFGGKPLNKLTAAEKVETIAHYQAVRDSARETL